MNSKTVLLCTLAVLCNPSGLVWSQPAPEAAFKLPTNLPSEYQSAISKAFPGYQILSPSEIFLDKEEIGDELYNKVKGSPGLIVGNFNGDNIQDFAALIRNLVKQTNIGTMGGKIISRYHFYGGHLVVCYGLGGGKFDCKILPGIVDEVHLPFNFALNKTGPGKYSCYTLRKLDLRRNRKASIDRYDVNYGEKHDININVKTDVIGLIMTTKSWVIDKYIYQSKSTFLNCDQSSD